MGKEIIRNEINIVRNAISFADAKDGRQSDYYRKSIFSQYKRNRKKGMNPITAMLSVREPM